MEKPTWLLTTLVYGEDLQRSMTQILRQRIRKKQQEDKFTPYIKCKSTGRVTGTKQLVD